MKIEVPPVDRRAALKARHRRAILDAATALISEGGSARFSVDQLAERADVSRRTVFNHFVSVDDVLTTACTELLATVVGDVREMVTAGPARTSMFESLAVAIRATDVPGIISFIWRALGCFGPDDPRPMGIFQAAFSRTTDELALQLADRYGAEDPLDAQLLVSSLIHGAEVIAHRWIHETQATTDDAARARWNELLERLIENIRTGY
jgi:TetR/AcrR family transcriptional regulator, regulator of autoinduction and epiphytic fitness